MLDTNRGTNQYPSPTLRLAEHHRIHVTQCTHSIVSHRHIWNLDQPEWYEIMDTGTYRYVPECTGIQLYIWYTGIPVLCTSMYQVCTVFLQVILP